MEGIFVNTRGIIIRTFVALRNGGGEEVEDVEAFGWHGIHISSTYLDKEHTYLARYYTRQQIKEYLLVRRTKCGGGWITAVRWEMWRRWSEGRLYYDMSRNKILKMLPKSLHWSHYHKIFHSSSSSTYQTPARQHHLLWRNLFSHEMLILYIVPNSLDLLHFLCAWNS